jgi:hypothetical protein
MCSVIGLLSALLAASASARDVKAGTKFSEKEACGDYGTSVHFYASPSEAARQAVKEKKLVFVLHVSGHFEDSDFT